MNVEPTSGIRRLLAERLGITEEELARMSGGDGQPTGPAAASAGADPTATLMSLLAQRNASTHRMPPQEDRSLDQALRAVQALQHQLRAANTRTERIAEALGACQDCWGADASCQGCGGRGGPGFAYPMKQQLLELIIPALAKLGLRIVDIGGAGEWKAEGSSHRKVKEA